MYRNLVIKFLLCLVIRLNKSGYLLLAMLGSIFTSLSYLIFIYNPVDVIITKVTAFTPDSIVFELWKDPPYEILVKMFIFNVSNAEEFLSGKEKLRFNEVGPYTYREILYNTNTSFNDNGTLSFIPKRRLVFVPEHSIGDPFVDTILSPNVPLLGITGSLQDYSMYVNIAVSSVSSMLGSTPFVNLTIDEYLNGYDDPLVTLANNIIPNWIDFPRFGLLDRMMALDNGSNIVTMNVNPEIKISENGVLTKEERLQKFTIQKWNGSPGLKQWGYKMEEGNQTEPGNTKCNVVEGSFMGTLFPQKLEKNTTLRLYRHAFCRPIPIKYDSSGFTKDGYEKFVYKVEEDFLATGEENPENSCYCRFSDRERCLPRGLGDLMPCYYDIPVAISQPHFLNGDPMLVEQVQGLSPNKEKHDLLMAIHPQLGIPLEAKLRVQLNLKMPDTKFNYKTKPFNNLVLPLFWAEVCLDSLPSKIKMYLTLCYHVLPVVQHIVVFALAISGVVLIFGSALAAVLLQTREEMVIPRFKVNYTSIPVFPLKTKYLKTEPLLGKQASSEQL